MILLNNVITFAVYQYILMARPSHNEEKRIELLSKATQCFRKYGYDKTTLDDIAKAMKLSKASLYYYIQNKEELFLEILTHEADRHLTELIKTAQSILDPLEKLNYFFTERARIYIDLIKLNSISKENVLALQTQFFKVYENSVQKEFDFVQTVLVKGKLTSCKGKKCQELTQIIFETANAIKHDTVMFGDILENPIEGLKDLQRKITTILQLILHSNYKF